ncbi:MAG TPA: magnesium transporter CorA family protein [Spirochaetota bacterium]|nr:magnesium transporter CorA family protein [Spirochaetota bacterium]
MHTITTMLKSYKITSGAIVEAPDENGDVLIYVNPTIEEKDLLIGNWNIDSHTLQSALDPDEQSRLEFEPDHAAIILKRPQNYSGGDQFLFKVSSMGLFWYSDRVVIILMEDIKLFDGKLFSRVQSVKDLVLRLILRTISHYIDHLKVINMISDSLEQKINASMKNKYLINLFTLEKSLVYYLNAINANAFVIERIRNNRARLALTEEHLEMLDDIIIENNQCHKQAEIYSNILAGLMDARVSIVSNNLNILMKTLNLVTIGIMVPTLVVSAFSMNVAIPMQRNPLAFWIIMGLACFSVIVFMLFWKLKKW